MSEIVFNPQQSGSSSEDVLKAQIENLQTTLAFLNQQVISLQEALQERDREIVDLKHNLYPSEPKKEETPRIDETLTVLGALIKLYELVRPSGKAL